VQGCNELGPRLRGDERKMVLAIHRKT